MENFTPIASLAGGALIGLSASLLLATAGRVAGISGILGGIIGGDGEERRWRLAFLAGLVIGGWYVGRLSPESLAMTIPRSGVAIVLGGLLVGFGTRLGGGCTSGHGVCGMSRLSQRSIAATCVFMATAAIVVFLVNHVLGGAI